MKPSDDDLHALFPGAALVARRPYAYATSSPLTEVVLQHPHGTQRLLLKQLHARRDYPPGRELTIYRDVLCPAGIGPRLYGCGDDWLLIELVEGVEIWQLGEFDRWLAVAAWLGEHHRRFAGFDEAPLLGEATLLAWLDRAAPRTTGLDLDAALTELQVLAQRPTTLVHGEFYPSNVLVSGSRVVPVDWETAGVGPGVLDLAAFVTGWREPQAQQLVEAYGGADARDLDRARLALALRWLGWTDTWTPPAEHRHDWLVEARAALARLNPVTA
ncbi:MAG: phosphotransferase [Jatrophihabitans sp.]|uniref:phosphotransferase n=1 Tax=Jatrophihabitans sp. TaxID=1932789 RepID=UPI003F7D878C